MDLLALFSYELSAFNRVEHKFASYLKQFAGVCLPYKVCANRLWAVLIVRSMDVFQQMLKQKSSLKSTFSEFATLVRR
jgi:hypothetical protein